MNLNAYYLIRESKIISGPYGSLEMAYEAKKKIHPLCFQLVSVVRQTIPVELIKD